jgi:polyisoprenoid-binding protein YceI
MNMRRSFSALALGTPSIMRLAVLCLFASAVLTPLGWTQAPVFAITPQTSTIKFSVSSSISIAGTFDTWDATLTFTSPDVTTGVLDIKIPWP